MKTFGSGITTELAKEIKKVFFLIELQASTTHRFTDCDIPLYSDGNKYQVFDFSIGAVNVSADMAVDSISLDFANPSLTFSSILLSEDLLNKTLILSFVCLDDDNQVILTPQEMFRGTVSNWTLDELKATLTVVNEFALWNKKALRQAQSSCPWPFKGDECSYSGVESWCDQSYDRCNELSNTDNFGGHRFLPDIQEKEIWWGRQPK